MIASAKLLVFFEPQITHLLKNKQAITLLFVANTISGIAQGISMIAIPWYFTNIINKGPAFGLLYAFLTMGSVFWVLYGGTLIDKHNRKAIFLSINTVGGIILISVAVTGFVLGSMPAFVAGLVFAVTFFIYNIHFPNLYAFAQEITIPQHYGRITSWLEIQNQSSSALAGGIAALLLGGINHPIFNLAGIQIQIPLMIHPWSLSQIFLMDGITYFLALVLIFFIRYESIAKRNPDTGKIIKRLKKGFHFLKDRPMLFLFGCLSHSIFITILVVTFFIMPIYIDNHMHRDVSVYASFEVMFAIGAIFSGIFIRHIFRNTRPTKVVIILTLATSIVYFLFMQNLILGIYIVLSFILGMSNAGTRIMRTTYIFNHIPNDMIGRAGSVFNQFQIFFRLFFILLFSFPFFAKENYVIYAMMVLSLFTALSATLLIIYYKRIIRVP